MRILRRAAFFNRRRSPALAAGLLVVAATFGIPASPTNADGASPPGPVFTGSLRTGVLMAGTPCATRYWVRDSGVPGPVIVLLGGCHGDEPAGYLAADKIARWKITRGTLWVLPRAHTMAIARNQRGYPDNMNNMFIGNPQGTNMERLAAAIWGLIVEAKPDLLLSLHESRDFHARVPQRYGQTLTYDFHALDASFQPALARVNADIKPPLHQFSTFVKPFPHCPTYNAWERLQVPGTAIETSKTLPLATRVHYQLMMVMGFFDEWGLGYEQGDAQRLSTAKRPPRTLQPRDLPVAPGAIVLPTRTPAG